MKYTKSPLWLKITSGREISRDEAVMAWNNVRVGNWGKLPPRFLKDFEYRVWIAQNVIDAHRAKNSGMFPSRPELIEEGLGGVLNHHNNSPYKLALDAGHATPGDPHYDEVLAFSPWLVFKKMPQNYWDDLDNCAAVILYRQRMLKRVPGYDDLPLSVVLPNGIAGALINAEYRAQNIDWTDGLKSGAMTA